MYELKIIRKVFTSKFVGTGPSSYKKRIYRAAVSHRLRNTALHCYEAATGERLNIRKSKIMGLSTWDVSVDILGIPFCNELRILGTQITTANQSANRSWALSAGTIGTRDREACYKTLNLDQRMLYVEKDLLDKAW